MSRRILTLVVSLALLTSWATSAAAQTGQVVEYYHLDALGSVRVVTDQAGQVIARHDFLPFGEEWPAPQPTTKEKKLFTGHERDAETDLDYFGARYYEAQVGRFTTIDPVYTWTENLVDPQRWNRYAYARSNPLKFVDPEGRDVRAYTERLGTATASAGAIARPRHTFIRVTFDEVDVTLELTGPVMDGAPGRPRVDWDPDPTNFGSGKWRKDVEEVPVERPPGIGPKDFSFEKRIIETFGLLGTNLPAYDARRANSNGFARFLIESAGGRVDLPFNAYFAGTSEYKKKFAEAVTTVLGFVRSALTR